MFIYSFWSGNDFCGGITVYDEPFLFNSNLNKLFCRLFLTDITAILEFITKMTQQLWPGSLSMNLDAHQILQEGLFRLKTSSLSNFILHINIQYQGNF